ncbi:MAG: hypothetical protein J6K72_06250 [Clostridia bacterium]|nr:hypothetical protein [Clostridia bacterium]
MLLDYKLKCDCENRIETEINSVRQDEEIRGFFFRETEKGVYLEMKPELPYYTWAHGSRKVTWFATKWYKCNACGCLWEYNEPDFPAKGFVRKFSSGSYHEGLD